MNIDWIWVENIRSPSIFSLPLMNSIGPAALPVTSFMKSTPSSFRVTRGSCLGSVLVVHLPSRDHDLPVVLAAVRAARDLQWITASTPARCPA